MAPNCRERGSAPRWGHPSPDGQPDPPKSHSKACPGLGGSQTCQGTVVWVSPGLHVSAPMAFRSGVPREGWVPQRDPKRAGKGMGFLLQSSAPSQPQIHGATSAATPGHGEPEHGPSQTPTPLAPGMVPHRWRLRHRPAPLPTGPAPRQPRPPRGAGSVRGGAEAPGRCRGPTATHRQLLVVGHLVRQGPDPLIGAVHPQAGAEPRQLLVAPRVVPAPAEKGMGTRSRTGHGRPRPPARASGTYQWWWVVRIALSTTSSFLTISSN